MGISALSGPLVQYGITVAQSTNGLTGNPADYNDQRAPIVVDLGHAMMDPRAAFAYQPGGSVTVPTYAFYNARCEVDFTPLAASSVAIVTNANSTGTTNFTLAAASSATGTYSVAITAPETGMTTGSLLTFDSSVASLRTNGFGTSDTINTWNPGWGAGRCVAVAASSYTDSGITIHGRDIYGFKISEIIAFSSNGSLTSSYGGVGVKAFKQIDGVTNSTTTNSSLIQVGTTDRYGMGMYVPYVASNITVRVSSTARTQNAAVALSSANFILAMASTATATSTTADVRGIYVSSVAVGGNYRLTINITPAASAAVTISSTNVAPFFGATQYST